MKYHIRPYEKNDLLSIASISEDDEYAQIHFQIAMSMDKANEELEKLFVAIVDEQIVGYIYGFVIPGKIAYPQFLYVIDNYRKNGLGTALLKKYEEESHTPTSMIYYRQELHDYYSSLGYLAGNNEVAIKQLPTNEGSK